MSTPKNFNPFHQRALVPALAAASFLLGCITPSWAAQIFVAPRGNDGAAGTRTRPLATLERAQQIARIAIARGEVAEVVLRGGTYEMSAPLVLGKQDSGLPQKPVCGARPAAKRCA